MLTVAVLFHVQAPALQMRLALSALEVKQEQLLVFLLRRFGQFNLKKRSHCLPKPEILFSLYALTRVQVGLLRHSASGASASRFVVIQIVSAHHAEDRSCVNQDYVIVDLGVQGWVMLMYAFATQWHAISQSKKLQRLLSTFVPVS